MEDDATMQRAIGKLVKEAMLLDSGLRALAVERDNKIEEINAEYRRKIEEKRRKIAEVMTQIQKLKRVAQAGVEDEELALGQAALKGGGHDLGVSAELLCLMHEMRDELGLGVGSYTALARKIDDCLYTVPPPPCTACTGGGGI